MASTGTPTPNHGLNQWQGSDKPRREDFNSDNRKIDAALANISIANVSVSGGSDATANGAIAIGNQATVERVLSTSYDPTTGMRRNNSNMAIGNNARVMRPFGPNIALGTSAHVLDGTRNTALGTDARITFGSNSMALGNNARVEANFGTAIGNYASIAASTNGFGLVVGNNARITDSAADFNIAIGNSAQITAGRENTVLGRQAQVTAGNNNIALGSSAIVTAIGSEGSVAIGRRADARHTASVILTPNDRSVTRSTTANNQILLGYSGITPTAFAALSNISDQRDKTEVTGLKYDALDFINAVQPKQYRMDFRSDYIRYEEITDSKFEKLDKYTQLHEVSDVQVYGIEGTDIEWIEDEVFLGEASAISLSNDGQPLENRYTTKCISKFAKNREVAIAEVRKRRSEVGVEAIGRLETRYDAGIDEIAETDIESLIKPTRKTKFLRVFVEPDGTKSGKRYHNGFLAQQVEQAAKDMGFDFAGVKYMAHNKDENGVPEGDDLYSLTYEEFVAPMVGAIQQLSRQNEGLKQQNNELEQRLQKLEEALSSR